MSVKRKSKKGRKPSSAFITVAVIIIILLIAAFVLLYVFKPDLLHRYTGIGAHTYTDWRTEKAPTCGESGSKYRECLVCGLREDDTLPPTGEHTYGEWSVTEPTCIKAGLKERTCSTCGDKESQILPATGEHRFNDGGVCRDCGFNRDLSGTAEEAASAEFSIHIIDLGKFAGDSVYIKAAGNDILIDAGSRAESADLICGYLENYVTDGKLEYVIATHADQDHIAAFAGNSSGGTQTGVLYRYAVDTFIKFDNVTKSKEGNASKPNTVYGKFCTAVEYLKNNGATVYTAGECYKEENGAKRQYWLDEERTLSMNILYNYYYDNVSTDENNHSVVTLFTKDTSSRSFNWLFTGDLEKDGESRLADYYSNPANSKSQYDVLPQVDFYKAGHHGSGTSSSEKLLNIIKPKYVAASCCAGAPEYTLNNGNTFPYKVTFGRLLEYTDKIYCTGMAINLPELDAGGNFTEKSWDYAPCNGNIVFYYIRPQDTAGTIKLWCSNSFEPVTETEWYKNYRA